MVSNSLRRAGAAQPVLEKSWKLEKKVSEKMDEKSEWGRGLFLETENAALTFFRKCRFAFWR
jgi:hypothetical protein